MPIIHRSRCLAVTITSLLLLASPAPSAPVVQSRLAALIQFDLNWLREDLDFQEMETLPLAEVLSVRDIVFLTLAFGGDGKLVLDIVDSVQIDLSETPATYAYRLSQKAYSLGPNAWKRFQISIAKVAQILTDQEQLVPDGPTMLQLLGNASTPNALTPEARHVSTSGARTPEARTLNLEEIAEIVLQSNPALDPRAPNPLTFIAEKILQDIEARTP
jgi:hypothetical protein